MNHLRFCLHVSSSACGPVYDHYVSYVIDGTTLTPACDCSCAVPRSASASLSEQQLAYLLRGVDNLPPSSGPYARSRSWSLVSPEQVKAANCSPQPRLSLVAPRTNISRLHLSDHLTGDDHHERPPSTSCDEVLLKLARASSSGSADTVAYSPTSARQQCSRSSITAGKNLRWSILRPTPSVVTKPVSRLDRAFRRSFRTSQFGLLEPPIAGTAAEGMLPLGQAGGNVEADAALQTGPSVASGQDLQAMVSALAAVGLRDVNCTGSWIPHVLMDAVHDHHAQCSCVVL